MDEIGLLQHHLILTGTHEKVKQEMLIVATSNKDPESQKLSSKKKLKLTNT